MLGIETKQMKPEEDQRAERKKLHPQKFFDDPGRLEEVNRHKKRRFVSGTDG